MAELLPLPIYVRMVDSNGVVVASFGTDDGNSYEQESPFSVGDNNFTLVFTGLYLRIYR